MTKFVVMIMFVSYVLPFSYAQNKPCSRGAGGIKACTKGGEFICNDGRISKSKKRCNASIYNPKSDNTKLSKDKKKD